MKMQFLVAGALLLSAPVFAQVQPPLAATAAEPSGYDLLVQAVGNILPGPNGGPSNTDPTISAEEDLKRERLAVTRNAPALALARQALQKPIAVPLATKYTDTSDVPAKVRELARQFSQESDVRLADGDFVAAMNSKLDTVELGARYEHGDFISMLVGVAAEAIGRKGMEKIVPHLDAAQCRTALQRLKAIDTIRPSYAEVLQNEQTETQALMMNSFAGAQNITDQERAKLDKNTLDLLPSLTPERIKADTIAVFAPIIENAALPYQQSLALRIEPSKNFLLQQTANIFVGGKGRFNYERNLTWNMLLQSALELQVQKLEAGVYPGTFAAPVDLFSPDGQPLVYKKTEQGYLLYSVGPDGKDDGGAEIETVFQGNEPGNETVTKQLMLNSTGDIVQPPL